MDADPQPSAPSSFEDLLGTLRDRFDSLSPAHKKLADRVRADPEGIAFMTGSELANVVGVNEATVARFASTLGLNGYPGLTKLCRERLQEQAQLLRRFDDLEQVVAEGGSVTERTVAFDQANIARTFSRIDGATWRSAVEHLAKCPAVHVIGLRVCHAPAILMGYLLGLIRESVWTVTASAGMLTDDLRRVRPGDCFVSMSLHRYSADTVRAAQWAHDVGAHVVTLTDNAGSPLAASADDAFFVDTLGTSVLNSMTAFTSLVQAITSGVAQARGSDVRGLLLEEEKMLQEFAVYTPPSKVLRNGGVDEGNARASTSKEKLIHKAVRRQPTR
jgi:DNA-binding MurR/RpiR family transcriptional regulator